MITKKVIATGQHVGTAAAPNEVQNVGTTQFRILGTSPNALLNSRVLFCCPITFDTLETNQMDDATALGAGARDWREIQVGPRRNGLLKATSTITSTINSSVSFSSRQECFDDIFSTDSMPNYQGGRETGTIGPDARPSPSRRSIMHLALLRWRQRV